MSKIILCADMDAFFASVEQQTNTCLRGKPIGIIGSGRRTFITNALYEARRFGIKTGMNIYEAKKVLPLLILVIGNNEKYTHTCKELETIYNQFTPDVEIYSIDEAFLDITSTHHLFGGPEAVGMSVKKAIKKRFGINCTVGIGPNILMAKLASDISKPDGLRWIKPEIIEEVLKDLPVKELWGIGSQISERLSALGIRTCGELGKVSVSLLRNKFGIYGEMLKAMGRGICNRPIQAKPEEAKSIGHSMRLPEDIWKRNKIEAYLLMLTEMVGRQARKYGYMGKIVSLVVRYTDFETFSKQTTLSKFTNDMHAIFQATLKIINAIKLKNKVRLLGASLSRLIKNTNQIPLIEEEKKGYISSKLSIILMINSASSKSHGVLTYSKKGIPV